MKTFQDFKEDMEQTLKGFSQQIVPQLQNFARQNKKSPKELTKMRDGITSKVMTNLGRKMDVKGIVNKIPDSQKMSDMVGKMQGKMSQKLKDPKTSEKFNKIFDMISTMQK